VFKASFSAAPEGSAWRVRHRGRGQVPEFVFLPSPKHTYAIEPTGEPMHEVESVVQGDRVLFHLPPACRARGWSATRRGCMRHNL